MTIDFIGATKDTKHIKIKAESEVPSVEIVPRDRLEFSEIFLRNRDFKELKLINNSKLRAKFEV